MGFEPACRITESVTPMPAIRDDQVTANRSISLLPRNRTPARDPAPPSDRESALVQGGRRLVHRRLGAFRA